MSCRSILKLLPLHAGGDLSSDEAREVERHVAVCEGCRAELSALTRSRQNLFALKGETVSPGRDLWPSVRLAIGVPPRRRVPPAIRYAAVLVVASALAVAFLVPEREPEIASSPGSMPSAGAVRDTAPDAPASADEFLLAEVGPVPGPEGVAEFPAVAPAEPGRLAWDDF
jgi:hypothetical protein